jgi:hypothetical protein
MNRRTFKATVARLFAKANPGAVATWAHGPVAVTWADGSKGLSGVLQASGAGYRARAMVATYHDGGVWIQ